MSDNTVALFTFFLMQIESPALNRFYQEAVEAIKKTHGPVTQDQRYSCSTNQGPLLRTGEFNYV